jgi:hypothetical protein
MKLAKNLLVPIAAANYHRGDVGCNTMKAATQKNFGKNPLWILLGHRKDLLIAPKRYNDIALVSGCQHMDAAKDDAVAGL